MATWGLLGGPDNETVGGGRVPDGYELESKGADLGPQYDPAVREAEVVYRWSADARDIEDANRLIQGVESGAIAFPSPIGEEHVSRLIGYLRTTLTALRTSPGTEEAEMLRDTLNKYREQGVI